MKFLVVVKVPISKPFAHWKARFDADSKARQASGVRDVFAYPVIGEQAVLFGLETSEPRLVHDMIYHAEIRPLIEESGFIVGQEHIILCEKVD